MITMRVTASDKRKMETVARACGLTLTEYVTRLHQLTAERLPLASKGRGRAKG
jgi:hypothetical protein